MEELKTQVQALNADDWQTFLTWITGDELKRREAQPSVEQAQADIVKELQDSGKLPLPDALTDAEKLPEDANDVPEWRDPGTDHSMMYREGDIVRHNGRIVRSTHKGLNSWEPGTLGFDGRIWEDIDTPGDEDDPQGERADSEPAQPNPATPAFKQPTGGHDAYKLGDRVTFNGEVYESTISGNVWSPTDYPAGWKKV